MLGLPGRIGLRFAMSDAGISECDVVDRKPRVSHRGRRIKGRKFENEVVERLQGCGLAAERIPLSGAAGGRFDHDVSCPVRGVDRKLECKIRERAFSTVNAMLGENFALVCRDGRSRTLVVMTLENFAELAK